MATPRSTTPDVSRTLVSAPTGRDGRRDAEHTLTILQHRWNGTHPMDDWGLDPELVDLVSPMFAARWRIDVDGAEHLPADGPAMVVCNRRAGISEMFVCSRGLRRATGRFIRPVGAPDVALIGPALRRFGVVQSSPDEVTGLLKGGELVAIPLERELTHRQLAGAAPLDHLAAAVAVGVPIVPVAIVGREIGRRWRLFVGEPIPSPERTGPLAVAELADVARRSVQDLLDRALPPSLLLR
ncbi:MAG: hypothetical protein ABI276_01785 [Acidimicrobiales bacterium]